jgi:large subunit ribosomal protein L18
MIMNKGKKPKENRRRRVRKKININSERLRLNVFRSNKYIYAQIIDDKKGTTLTAVSEKEMFKESKKKKKKIQTKSKRKAADKDLNKLTKSEKAALVGEIIAEKAKKIGKTKVSFDRGSYKYHGRIKILAESARKHGLIF